ncbi:hypothetical protein JS82_01535 [Methanomassiliicoccaceae archaeon DOK]|nr:hypothetical protein JS82_01535 [Methanomassiliicoccaceae archaeon DOK]
MDQPSMDELSMLTRVNLIFRFSYTIPFLLASVCGVVYAVPYDVPWHIMVLIPVAVLLLALFVNFSNDYFDHKSGVDKKVNDRKSRTRDNLMTSDAVKRVYWEGNQFDTGLVTERQGKAIMAALLVLIVIVALPVIAYGGWSVVVLGLIGAALAFFYTAPPVNLGARGLGEVSVAISFFMMCFCSFYVATGTLTVEILLFSVMIGIIVGLMRLIDSMSANDVHLEMHEVNMSIRLGTEGTVRAIKAAVVIAYVLAALMCYYNLLNVLLFATLLITVKMVRVIDARREHWDVAIIPFSFLFSLLTEVLFLVVTLCTMAVGPVVFW